MFHNNRKPIAALKKLWSKIYRITPVHPFVQLGTVTEASTANPHINQSNLLNSLGGSKLVVTNCFCNFKLRHALELTQSNHYSGVEVEASSIVGVNPYMR